jgi:hypothetical protein
MVTARRVRVLARVAASARGQAARGEVGHGEIAEAVAMTASYSSWLTPVLWTRVREQRGRMAHRAADATLQQIAGASALFGDLKEGLQPSSSVGPKRRCRAWKAKGPSSTKAGFFSLLSARRRRLL